MMQENQRINVYDFDKTIYSGDASVDFWKFCLPRYPKILLTLPKVSLAFVKYLFGVSEKTEFKEAFFSFLRYVPDVDFVVSEFWEKHFSKMQNWYLEVKKDSDLIISASPEFLLKPVCERLGVSLIASQVEKKTGKFSRKNCYGDEKVRRLRAGFSDVSIAEFSSDSLSDAPLAEISEKAFIVSRGKRVLWDEYRPGVISKMKKTFLSRDFLLFVFCGGMGTLSYFITALFLSLLIDPTISFIFGYGLSLFVTYSLTASIIYHERLQVTRFGKFVLSYIPNFLTQFVFVSIFLNIFLWNKVIVYILAVLVGLPITFLCVKYFAFSKRLSHKKSVK